MSRREGADLVAVEGGQPGGARAHLEDALGRASDEDSPAAVAGTVHGGVVALLGGEGDLGDPRQLQLQLGARDSALRGEHEQRHLGGIAEHLGLVARPRPMLGSGLVRQRGVVTQRCRAQRQAQRFLGRLRQRAAVRLQLAVEVVAGARHLEGMPGAPQPAHRHAILGQRSGLVGADHRAAAERLHGRQSPHHDVAPRHTLHA